MMANIVAAQFKLQYVDIPESARNKGLLAFISLQNIVGMVIGIFIFVINFFNFLLTFEKMKYFFQRIIEKTKGNRS